MGWPMGLGPGFVHTHFFSPIAAMWQFENSCDEIAQPDGLTLPVIGSNDRRKTREPARLKNADI